MNYRTNTTLFQRLSLALISTGFAASFSWAQVAKSTDNTAATMPDAATLAKYDKNKNGQLDPDELAAMKADMEKAAAVPVTSAAPADKDVIELSPFEVNGADDKGYAASNTLAGTRINSKLEDIAGSVSVVTKQQLIDTAAIDINDIFMYEVGTEGTRQFTDLTSDGRGDYDNVAGNPTGSNRVRGLSAANIAVDGFAASSSIPIDTYNISAVEIARGANSSLAGVGEAGGTVNVVQNRAALARSTTNFTTRVDSYDGFRFTLDLNRPLFRNKLALRVSAAYEEKGYVRKPSNDRIDRQTLVLSYKPFPKTNISASYEWLNEWARRANSVTPRDTITLWRANGSPTWDWKTRTYTVNGVRQAPITDVNATATRPTGIVTLGSSGVRVLQYIDDGKINYMMNGNNGNLQQFTKSTDVSAAGPLFKVPGTTDQAIYDWTKINLAAPNYEIQNARVFNAKLEQALLNTRLFQMNLEAAWRKEDQKIYQRSFIAQQDGIGNTLSVDTNEYLNDGRKNPFFKLPFIGGVNPQVYHKLNYVENGRMQLATNLDLTREKNWLKRLGRHRVNGYAEYRYNVRAPSERYHDTIGAQPYFNPATNTNGTPRNLFANNGALMYPLYYFGKTPGGGVEYGNTGPANPTGYGFVASYPSVATSTTVLTSPYVVDTPVEIREAFFSPQSVQKKINRTFGGTIQSFFLNDSIVTTFGQRRDRAYTIDSFGSAPVVDGYMLDTQLFNFGVSKRWRTGDTDTRGLVARPFKELAFVRRAAESTGFARFFGQAVQGFSLHYNDSQNFSPADAAYNLYLQELPNPTGQSKEYGFSLRLFDDKFTMRVTRQETLQANTRAGTGVLATRAMSIDLDIPGQTRNFDLLGALRVWYLGTTATPGIHPEWTEDQFRAKAAQVMQFPREKLDLLLSGGFNIADSSDAKSTGTELELQFNPTRYWTLRATGGQQRAIESKVSKYIQQYMAERLPVWQSIIVPTELRPDGTPYPGAGTPWFTTATTGDIPYNYYLGTVLQPLNLAIANQGKLKTQNREYTLNVTTRYQLAGLVSRNSWLKSLSVGGSYRWASRASIGYLGAAPDSDGVVRSLDRNKPVYNKATGNIDLLLSYNARLFSNKIRANFQLNVRNITESGHLQGVGVNPDGQFWQYRIVDPRQYILSASFDL